ncbi:MAG TPA: PAS domain-containing sensor histidine kinase, partial [Polyangiaceae bacterium]|nr:PAS domain-containing sensor histidine kinase [Polyangiaceae bacterium]
MRLELDEVQPFSLLERLVETSADGLLVFDREYRYVLWNPAMEQISGLPAEKVLGALAFDVFPFLLESAEDELLREALAGRATSVKERPFYVSGSGRQGYYDAQYFPLRSQRGEIVAGIGIVRDVTEAKRARERIQETENRFKNMADAAPVLLWMSATDGLCTFFNQTWLDFTGRTLEQEWGVGWAEGIHFEDFQGCMDTYLAAFNRREIFEMEYRLRRHDGEFRWILDRGTPRYMPDGTFAGYIGSCIDITERKRLEEELRHAVRARDEFLSIASHELRTPLAALQLHLETMIRALNRTPKDVARLESKAARALDKTLHLGTMINVLLDVSRISEGQLPLEYEQVALASLVRDVVERLRDAAAGANCAVELRIFAEPLGSCDKFRVEQIVTNLLSNAIKYGAGKPVTVSLRQTPDRVQIEVADNGPGIAPEHHALVFERFARFVPTRHYGGFGLGLWIAREIALAHGGRIGLHS